MNEQEAIEQLSNEYLVSVTGKETSASVRYHNEALDMAIAALKEVQEYHETGHTPKMIRELRRGYINAHKTACQYAIELDEYHRLEKHVVLEVAVEKQMPKKAREIDGILVCPDCETYVGTGDSLEHQYCPECGQKVSV